LISSDVEPGAAAMRSRSRPGFDAGIVNRLGETSLPIRTGSKALRPIGLDPSPLGSSSTARGCLLCSPTVRNDRDLQVVEVSAIGSAGRGGDAGFNVSLDRAGQDFCNYLHDKKLVRSGASGLTLIACRVAESSILSRDKRVLSRVRAFPSRRAGTSNASDLLASPFRRDDQDHRHAAPVLRSPPGTLPCSTVGGPRARQEPTPGSE
jgi:hypothetical protein